MNALSDDLAHNLDVHSHFISEAAGDGCDLIVFTEQSVTGHFGAEEALQFAEEAADGLIVAFMHDQAREHNLIIAYGFCELAHGTPYNTHALVGPDGLMGVQRKAHASKDEYFFFRMGRNLEVFDLGFCRVGVLVCYDSQFCEAWRVLALKEAELILLPHATRSGAGKEVHRHKQRESLRARLTTLPAEVGVYARANAVFAAACDQVGFNGHTTLEAPTLLGPLATLSRGQNPHSAIYGSAQSWIRSCCGKQDRTRIAH